MKKRLVLVSWLLCLLSPLHAQQTHPPASPTPPIQTGGEIAARAGAEVWLALVDDGQYDQSYDSAASAVKKTVAKDAWTKVFVDHRKPLGKVLARNYKNSFSSTSLPGAPPGQYVTVRFDASFEHKKTAVETLTVMLDESGQWRVSGYFVQ